MEKQSMEPNQDLDKQNDFQKKYFELQMIDNRLKQIEKQVELFESQILEALTIIQSLDELKESKADVKSLAPLANGIFVETKLENVQNLLVNVGSGVVVKKSIDETKQMLQNQVDELRVGEQEFVQQFEVLSLKAQNIQKDMNQML